MPRQLIYYFFCLLFFYQTAVVADETIYKVNSGDILEVSVWKEEDLQREIRVLPDGHISFPLVGDIKISGLTLNQVKDRLVEKLSEYVSEPVVNISVKSVEGNIVYVIGQVKQPGQFIMYQALDVMQVLSLAGGLTAFAKANDILVLRRGEEGTDALNFKYGELEDGDNLDENHLLKSGDVIIVP